MRTPRFQDLKPLCHVLTIPLRTPFRGLTHREVLLIEGPQGPAEWSPFLEYDDQESARWLGAALEQAYEECDLEPQSVRVNGTIPAIPAEDVPALLQAAGNPGTVKVKVGGPGTTLLEDVARVTALRRALGPHGRIRLDANGSWTLDEAEHAVREMEHLDLDYLEQPVASLGDMAELRRRISRLGIGVAADESIRRYSDIDAVLEASACDVVVVKVQPLGGLAATQKIALQALQAGLDVVVSSALETSVGLYRGAQMVSWLETQKSPVLDAGLGTGIFLETDVLITPWSLQDGVLELGPPELNLETVEAVRANATRTTWWFERLERCVALL